MFSEEARRHNIRRASGIAGVLLLATCAGVIPQAVTAQQQSLQQKMLLSGHVNYSHISPPTSGVKLLEDIFLKVRSAPQIAMARNLMKQQQQVATNSDPLQIRPKKSTGRALPSPSLNIIAAAPSLSEAFGGGGMGSASEAQNIPVAQAQPQMVLGNRTFPLQQASNKPTTPGMWSVDESERGRTSQQPPDLRTATSRLFGVMNGLQQAQNAGNVMRDQRIATGLLPPASNSKYQAPTDNLQTSFQEADGYVGADREQAAGKADSRRRDSNKDKDQPALKRKTASAAKEESGADASYRGINLDEKKAKLAMADIALLPPNVVTGIPLVHLGSSEQQASGALQSIGSMKQQKVQKWTVWSWGRPQAKTGTSLQLYMRNGLLDAMRIFDSSLIGTDFGVNVGDSMGRVKEKFGEPAFIVDEPQPGAGRNYIYPISQIGFQLARPAPGDQPRVVSVLIFNVK